MYRHASGSTLAAPQLLLDNLQILLVAVVGWLKLDGLVVCFVGFLELVVGEKGEAESAPRLAIARIDLERVLAVLDGRHEVAKLGLSGRSVAIVHSVVLVDFNRLVVLL